MIFGFGTKPVSDLRQFLMLYHSNKNVGLKMNSRKNINLYINKLYAKKKDRWCDASEDLGRERDCVFNDIVLWTGLLSQR